MMKSWIAVAGFVLASCAAAEQAVDRRVPADAQGEVEVSSVAGSVSVSGWDRNEVQVRGTLGDDVEQLELESEPKRTLINVVPKESSGWRRHGDADAELSIRIPTGSRLSINTVSAEISVTRVNGEQRLQSVSGDISSELASEEVEAKTVSGNVVLRGDGKPAVVTVTTTSGDAQVRHAAGEIVARSVSGDLELELDQITRARAHTTSGDLELQGRLARDARVDAETISGEVILDLKGPVNAEFELESFSGDIDNCFGPKPQSKSEHGPGSELRFKEGDGSARVRLRSLSGDINLCTS